MLILKKISSKQTEKYILFFLGAIILLFFSVNSYLLFRQSKFGTAKLSPDNIETVSMLYLKGHKKEQSGYILDCSGFTRRVYKQCNAAIPYSAKEQYASCKHLTVTELRRGDLVFFTMNERDISHTGIYLDSNRFIHSPGKMKYVRIDSLTSPFWEKHFVCGGKPNFNSLAKLN